MMKWLGVLLLLCFATIGVAHVVKPDYFVKRSGARKGGELLKDWNGLGFQIAGLIVAAAAIYGIFLILHSN